MKHLVLVGACYLDTILSVPRYPEEDSKLRASRLSTRRGGNCPNSLEVLQQLIQPEEEVRLYLVAALPEAGSAATQRIKASFEPSQSVASHINLDFCYFRAGHHEAASSYIIRSEESGSRTLVNYNDLPEMTAEEFQTVAQSFSRERDTWWHFEGRIPSTTLECVQYLRMNLPDATISVEIEKPGRPGLVPLASAADVVFYSKSWAEDRGYDSAEACLRKEDHTIARLGLCTWGADGAVLIKYQSKEVHYCPVRPEDKQASVVDSVGAGDTFIAAILYTFFCKPGPTKYQEKLRFAVRLASAKVQMEGFQSLQAMAPSLQVDAELC